MEFWSGIHYVLHVTKPPTQSLIHNKGRKWNKLIYVYDMYYIYAFLMKEKSMSHQRHKNTAVPEICLGLENSERHICHLRTWKECVFCCWVVF